MMYIKSFIEELSKKVETVEIQLNDFESKMNKISEVKNMITLKTLKDIEDLKGVDLILLSKDEFAQILDVFKFDAQEEKIKIFFNASVAIKVNQKLLSDGEITINDNLEWECPNCGNKDKNKMNVTRRTCGYLGENFWNVGKTKEIKSRVMHL